MKPSPSTTRWWLTIALCCSLVACSEPADEPDVDNEPDAAEPDAAETDAGETDVGDSDVNDSDVDDEPEVVDLSAGETRVEPVDAPLELSIDGETYAFSQAFFGLTHPDASEDGHTELYLEATFGGDEGCPTQESGSPDRTLLITGVYLDAQGALAAEEPQLILFDYVSDFVDPEANPPLIRNEGTPQISVIESDICTDCLGEPEPSQPDSLLKFFVASAMGEGGQLQGMIEATHCDSMDLLP